MKYHITPGRNPVISFIDGLVIQTIGDPHLGRNFKNNLKNKIGIRENMVFNSFTELLKAPSDYCVVMGDLFDKAVISNECLQRTIQILEDISLSYPTRKFIILSGNHDLFKNKHKVSSFELLYDYFNKNPIENLIIVKDKSEIISEDNLSMIFTDYDPFKTIDEKLSPNDFPINNFCLAFGHWDTENYGNSKFIDRTIPKILLKNCDLIVTGHEHKPSVKTIENKNVVITGSLQPYSFGEEIEGEDLYVTVLKEELQKILDNNDKEFSKSNVRVILESKEDYPEPFDCLSISYKHTQKESEEELEELSKNTLDSFKDHFLNILKQHKTEENKSFIKEIKKAFLEKNYESN